MVLPQTFPYKTSFNSLWNSTLTLAILSLIGHHKIVRESIF